MPLPSLMLRGGGSPAARHPCLVPRRECLPLGRITLVGTARQARQGMSDKNLHVAAAIIVRDGAVLAAQRSHGMKDGWELPGGKLEPGETSEDACRREIREELGLELGVLWPFTTVRHSYPDFDIEMDVFCAPIASDAEPQMPRPRGRCAGLAETSCCPWTGCLQTSRWCARWPCLERRVRQHAHVAGTGPAPRCRGDRLTPSPSVTALQ